MSQLLEVDASVVPRLTARRSFLVVAIALAAGIGARAGVLALALAQVVDERAEAAAADTATGWEGLGTALLGAVVGLALFVVVAIAVVGIGLRGTRGAGRFTAMFAGMLLATLVAQSLSGGNGGLGAVGIPRLGTTELAAVVVGLSLSWALPSAIVGALRWRWVAVVLVASAALGLLQSVVF